MKFVGVLAKSFGILAFAFGTSVPSLATGAVYTTYSFNGPNAIDAETCGSTGTVQGCSADASLTNLLGPCAILEGPLSVSGQTTAQDVYVLQTGSDAAPVVALKIFTKSVTIQPQNITATISLRRSVTIPSFHGGTKLTCAMAANPTSIFLGITGAEHVVQLNRKNFIGHGFGGGGLPPLHFTSMTADEAGYVSVYFGGGLNKSFYVFGPDGKSLSLGGAGDPVFIPNQTNGVSLK